MCFKIVAFKALMNLQYLQDVDDTTYLLARKSEGRQPRPRGATRVKAGSGPAEAGSPSPTSVTLVVGEVTRGGVDQMFLSAVLTICFSF